MIADLKEDLSITAAAVRSDPLALQNRGRSGTSESRLFSKGSGLFVNIHVDDTHHSSLLRGLQEFYCRPPHPSSSFTAIEPSNPPFSYNLLYVATFNHEWVDIDISLRSQALHSSIRSTSSMSPLERRIIASRSGSSL